MAFEDVQACPPVTKEREKTPYKEYEITDEDYRNRDRWEAYVSAVDEMVARTHTPDAPWTLVAAEDKRNARVRVIEEVCAGPEQALGQILAAARRSYRTQERDAGAGPS